MAPRLPARLRHAGAAGAPWLSLGTSRLVADARLAVDPRRAAPRRQRSLHALGDQADQRRAGGGRRRVRGPVTQPRADRALGPPPRGADGARRRRGAALSLGARRLAAFRIIAIGAL